MADNFPDGNQFSGFRGVGDGDGALARANRGGAAGRASNGRARVPGQVGADVAADGGTEVDDDTAATTPNPLPALDLSRLGDRPADLTARPAPAPDPARSRDAAPLRDPAEPGDAAPARDAAEARHPSRSPDPTPPADPAWRSAPRDTPRAPDPAEHPLLRGLLRELPPKGTPLPPGWLERWFAATRSVLELIYAEPPRGS